MCVLVYTSNYWESTVYLREKNREFQFGTPKTPFRKKKTSLRVRIIWFMRAVKPEPRSLYKL